MPHIPYYQDQTLESMPYNKCNKCSFKYVYIGKVKKGFMYYCKMCNQIKLLLNIL